MRSGGNPTVVSELVWALAKSGEIDEAEQLFERLRTRRDTNGLPSICLAWCCANLGKPDQAFEWLEQATRERCLELVGLNADPMFDSLRHDPRFQSVVRAVGL